MVSEKEKVRSKDKRKTRLNSNGRPVSKIGKSRVQNWKSDPMNSPKAFGELKILKCVSHNYIISFCMIVFFPYLPRSDAPNAFSYFSLVFDNKIKDD